MKAWLRVVVSWLMAHVAVGQVVYSLDQASMANPPIDWTPTPMEEEIRWHLNRGRFDSTAENVLRSTAYTGLPALLGPLAPHYALTAAARHHSEDLARHNLFQHETVRESSFYNSATHRTPMARMSFEGYTGVTSTNENISAGRDTALSAYLSWWNSSAHRTGMFSGELKEIGLGYVYRPGSRWIHYHTMDLAVAGNQHFFTGTIFHDANQNGSYNSDEGRGGTRVELRINGSAHSYFDVSTSVGSFAIPITSIPAESTVEVSLTNPTSQQISLSIPQSHSQLAPLQLSPGQVHSWGSFRKSSRHENVGFRQLVAATRQPISAPQVNLQVRNGVVTLSWASQDGYIYQPRWSTNLRTWQNLGVPLLGNGSTLATTDAATTRPRYYQVAVFASP